MFKNSLVGFSLFMILSLVNIVLANPKDDFISIWRTETQNEIITIPTTGAGYNYDIDWNNDGHFELRGVNGNASHSFATTGDHTIRIQGSFPRIYINNGKERDKIRSIEQWGTGQWRSMASAFSGAKYLIVNAKDTPNLSAVTDMSMMFSGAEKFNQNINNWDVSNVKDMHRMFEYAISFNQPLYHWNVSSVTDMSVMFGGAEKFNQDLNNWDVGNVTTMEAMFIEATEFNQDLSKWNVSKVTTMLRMFYIATSFNQDISKWNVKNVTNMGYMFYSAVVFNQDIGKWDVSSVTNMEGMFWSASEFNQPLNHWDVRSVKNMSRMFDKVTLSHEIYDSLLIGWAMKPLQSDVCFNAGYSQYCSAEAQTAKNYIKITNAWVIRDGGRCIYP